MRRYGQLARSIILTTPTAFLIGPPDISLTRRREWLQVQVINPATRLLTALDDKNAHYFSSWPNDTGITHVLDRSESNQVLAKLLDFATALKGELEYQLAEPAPQTSELKAAIVFNILSIAMDTFPQLKFSRGQYDNRLRTCLLYTSDAADE